MHFTIIQDLQALGINSGDATEISRQLEENDRAEIILDKDGLSADVLEGECSINGYKIELGKEASDANQINLIITRPKY
ncbi:MAG: hypothetical protein HOC78_01675 [Candidatus Komeilibacteria bacterium]|jgi:hypothetical protein|nr:hypothetical protein [Candidatus Komeilibacteria bacterium]